MRARQWWIIAAGLFAAAAVALAAATPRQLVDDMVRGTWLEPAFRLLIARINDSQFEPSECSEVTVQLGRSTNVVLIAMDTVRARHLGYLGYSRPVSPNLDELAEQAVAFTNARSAAPWTLPAFSAAFTGIHPGALGIQHDRRRIPDERATLGTLLCQAGYQTAGVVSHTLVGQAYGFARGFERWDESNAVSHAYVSSARVTDRALDYLAGFARDPRPFFLFAHYFDAHYEYLEHEAFPFGTEDTGRVRSVRNDMGALQAMARRGTLDAADLAHLRDAYDSEIAFTDSQVGRLLGALHEQGLFNETLILFIGDHGEAFAERPERWIGHTRFLYDEAIHVPLLVKPPAGDATVVHQPVSMVDLLATVLDVLEHPSPPPAAKIDRSLLRLDDNPNRLVFSQTRRDAVRDSVVDGHWKLIRNGKTGAVELFNLIKDPGEVNNRAHEKARVRELEARLDEWLAALEQEGRTISRSSVPAISKSERERLRALGYGE